LLDPLFAVYIVSNRSRSSRCESERENRHWSNPSSFRASAARGAPIASRLHRQRSVRRSQQRAWVVSKCVASRRAFSPACLSLSLSLSLSPLRLCVSPCVCLSLSLSLFLSLSLSLSLSLFLSLYLPIFFLSFDSGSHARIRERDWKYAATRVRRKFTCERSCETPSRDERWSRSLVKFAAFVRARHPVRGNALRLDPSAIRIVDPRGIVIPVDLPCDLVRACVRACVRVCVLRLRGTGCDGVFTRHVPNDRVEPLRAPKFVEYAGVLAGSDLPASRAKLPSIAVCRGCACGVLCGDATTADKHRLSASAAIPRSNDKRRLSRVYPRAGNDAKLPSLPRSDQSDSRGLRAGLP